MRIFRNIVKRRGMWVGVVLLILTVLGATAAEPLVARSTRDEPKRVLVVHSFINAAPPFTTHSTAFETTLAAEIGERVDMDEVSLDVARFATTDMEEALVEYLLKRGETWRPDLVVPIGSPAGVFVAKHRARLFPSTPIIYTGMDQRRLPPDALQQNAAFVGESFDFPGMIDNILQMAPETTNIAVVLGASQLEQYWATAIQREWMPFTNRVGFSWLNDLSFDQMLERVSHLPPRSFIFLILLMRDASGVTHNADEALHRIHAVANAPIYGIFQHQLGMGIVGGRLYQAELEGKESARIAVRVLRGEPATNFPPKLIGPLGPRYDRRELQRWNIDEGRLPTGSTVLFRQPSFWDRYQWWIIAGVSVFAIEAVLIVVLWLNRVQRRRAERSLRENENRLRAVLNTAVDGIITINERGIIESVNSATETLFGYSSSELVGKHVNILMPQLHSNEHEQHLENYKRTNKAKIIGAGGEFSGMRKDGSVFPLELAVSEIQQADRRIFTGFVRDISERKKAEKSLREFSGRLIRAHEEERARLARELHDDVTQRLAILAIEAGRLERGDSDSTAADTLRRIREGLVLLSEDVHTLSYQLHPSVLADLGLAEALKAECEHFTRREKLPAKVNLRDIPDAISHDVALCLFRIAQEALRNVARHARASTVNVSLWRGDGSLQLSIRDDGAGFNPVLQRQRPSIGLASMQERAHQLGGELVIESVLGEGTTISARIPWNELAS